jgi:hypothetical protein
MADNVARGHGTKINASVDFSRIATKVAMQLM